MAAALAKIFGSGKKGEPPSPQQAIQKLRETEEMLSKKTEFLEKKIEKEMQTVKKNGMKNKRGEPRLGVATCLLRYSRTLYPLNVYIPGHYQCYVNMYCTCTSLTRISFLTLPNTIMYTHTFKPSMDVHCTCMISALSPTFSAALNALKRKKRLDKQLQQIDGTLSTIEFQREALENAQTNTEVLRNMSYAAKALKAAHQHL